MERFLCVSTPIQSCSHVHATKRCYYTKTSSTIPLHVETKNLVHRCQPAPLYLQCNCSFLSSPISLPKHSSKHITMKPNRLRKRTSKTLSIPALFLLIPKVLWRIYWDQLSLDGVPFIPV